MKGILGGAILFLLWLGTTAAGTMAPGTGTSDAPLVAHPAPASTPKTVNVQVLDFAFEPEAIVINPGDTVTWVRMEGFHNVQADDGSWGNEASSSWTTFSHTFTEPGIVPYHCQVHGGPGGQGMSGWILVEDPSLTEHLYLPVVSQE